MDKLPATVKSSIPKAEAEELQKKLTAGMVAPACSPSLLKSADLLQRPTSQLGMRVLTVSALDAVGAEVALQ